MHSYLEKNLSFLSKEDKEKILQSEPIGEIIFTKTNQKNIKIENIYFHSNHDPIKEAERFLGSLKSNSEEKLYIFFGAGLGYSIQLALKDPKIVVVWMEVSTYLLRLALEIYDYSTPLASGKLRILIKPFLEEKLYNTFRGLGTLTTTFLPHRASFQWKFEEYSECKFICEKFFQKKDVNIATLSKFETIWTRNILQNLPELQNFKPVSLLFGLAKEIPILVTGAGPSLYYDLKEIQRYRSYFLLITVDTALPILDKHNISPDLIYSVDPQPINRAYLEGYEGEGILIFDPTSTYHSLRLGNFQKGFYSSSPFPLFKLFTKHVIQEIGDVPFGGSVSTNSVSLAELMGASQVLLSGQDLAFSDGYAHCRGAILEERLNYKESRKFRRELHNYRQLYALQKIQVEGYDGKLYHTNEKMQIFRKWFEEHSQNKNWINLSSKGAKIANIPKLSYKEYFNSLCGSIPTKVKKIQGHIKEILNREENYFQKENFALEVKDVIQNLSEFEHILKEGKNLSEKIYLLIQKKQNNSNEFYKSLQEIEKIDEIVSQKKGVNEIIGLGVQRVILTITEDYDTLLSLEEKKDRDLGIAKKSVLLYSGLYETTKLIKKSLKKVLLRL